MKFWFNKWSTRGKSSSYHFMMTDEEDTPQMLPMSFTFDRNPQTGYPIVRLGFLETEDLIKLKEAIEKTLAKEKQ